MRLRLNLVSHTHAHRVFLATLLLESKSNASVTLDRLFENCLSLFRAKGLPIPSRSELERM